MTIGWIIGSAALGVLTGPRIRACAFTRSTQAGQAPRSSCPACGKQILPVRHRWRSVLPVTGRCPACKSRIGPYLLVAEFAAGLAMAIVATRAWSGWELAALAWLVLLAVPLAVIDIAVRRLPNPLTTAATAGTLVLLTVAALAGHQPGHLARAAIGAVALSFFYLLLCLIRPGGMGLGDVKLTVSVGLVLGWISWQALFAGTLTTFVLAAVYGLALLATRRAGRGSQFPLGPFILVGALAAVALLPAGA